MDWKKAGKKLLFPPVWLMALMIPISAAALAYPVYNRVLKKQRQRIAPQILRLTEELLK